VDLACWGLRGPEWGGALWSHLLRGRAGFSFGGFTGGHSVKSGDPPRLLTRLLKASQHPRAVPEEQRGREEAEVSAFYFRLPGNLILQIEPQGRGCVPLFRGRTVPRGITRVLCVDFAWALDFSLCEVRQGCQTLQLIHFPQSPEQEVRWIPSPATMPGTFPEVPHALCGSRGRVECLLCKCEALSQTRFHQ
jgi:hypothetical protein